MGAMKTLKEQIHMEAQAESAAAARLRKAQGELPSEIADFEEQALRNNILWKEFAEHEARSMCLQHEFTEAELVRSDLKADVANIQEDVCGARKDVQWARQYRSVENRKLANLEMEVLSAHAELESEQRQVRTMAIADELRSVQMRSEALQLGRAELKQAEESCHGVQAVEELR